MLRNDLERIGFRVEKDKKNKIKMPILYGLNGKVEKGYEVDGYNEETHTILEIEAAAGVANNSFLKDLFEACLIKEAEYLITAVRNTYLKSKDFNRVSSFYDALYASNRVKLPLKGILIIGY